MSLSTALAQEHRTQQFTDKAGYTYQQVSNDPSKTRVYTLPNGLTVYLSKKQNTPRIQTYIAVRTGSNNDPADNTGLAHYLEHMLFKGTSRMGSLNWSAERVELQKISDLYEAHKRSTDPTERTRLYRSIDSISQVAAKYAAPNEYDRLMASIGAKGTNAHTWVDETVYKNDIPANELERWLSIESERFDELVLRLFHTEMEAVYEEFNMGQDNVYRRVFKVVNEALFPTHPYGQQTTIGTSEHLKNPSHQAIHSYWQKYYVPNNYAIVLVGDLDYEASIKLVDKYFGSKAKKPLEPPVFAPEKPLPGIVEREVITKDPEYLFMAYRIDANSRSRESILALICGNLLNNGQAGLFDQALNQAQKVARANSSTMVYKDYSVLEVTVTPKAGQTLEEAKALAVEQVGRLQRGDFPDWLIEAVVNEIERRNQQQMQDNDPVATALYEGYIHGTSRLEQLEFFKTLRTITKQDVMAFAKTHLADRYVVVYKRQGEDQALIRVENPGITPLVLDRNSISDYGKQMLSQQSDRLSPVYVDFDKAIQRSNYRGIQIDYIPNTETSLFELRLIFDMGAYHDRYLPLLSPYLSYLGTSKMSAEQVQQEFYKLGVSYRFAVGNRQTTIYLEGLERNMPKALQLLLEVLGDVQPDAKAFDGLKQRIYKSRRDAKNSQNAIFQQAISYATYGANSPERDIISREELEAMSPATLAQSIRELLGYKHRIFYYGSSLKPLQKTLKTYHKAGQKDYPAERTYTKLPTGGKVIVADYDMVQVQMLMLRRSGTYDARQAALTRLFNSYFGLGMASQVFQEIREARSLAYSAYAYYGGASYKDDYSYMRASVGTQSNKLAEAFEAMQGLMTKMPEVQKSFEAAKEKMLRDIEAERIIRTEIFDRYEFLKRLGQQTDDREAIYNEIKKLELKDLVRFFEQNVHSKDYTYVLVGRRADMPEELLKSLGEVEVVNLDYLFNNNE